MKKSTIIELIIILVLAIILGVLVKFTLETINQNNILKMPNQSMGQLGEMPVQNGMNSNVTYTASKEITDDSVINSEEYSSEKADENALLVNGNIEATISNVKVNKTGDSTGGDNTSFYGINSAILATSGANLNLKNIKVTTNATGANVKLNARSVFHSSVSPLNPKSDARVIISA